MKYVINKSGEKVPVFKSKNNKFENNIEEILTNIGVDYVSQFYFDETGLRKHKYDFAVMKNDKTVGFLIECDGPSHYDEQYYRMCGTPENRTAIHVIRQQLSDAEKTKIAMKYNVPILRVTSLFEKCMRDVILTWIWTFIDETTISNKELSAIGMFEKYGWDFPYYNKK